MSVARVVSVAPRSDQQHVKIPHNLIRWQSKTSLEAIEWCGPIGLKQLRENIDHIWHYSFADLSISHYDSILSYPIISLYTVRYKAGYPCLPFPTVLSVLLHYWYPSPHHLSYCQSIASLIYVNTVHCNFSFQELSLWHIFFMPMRITVDVFFSVFMDNGNTQPHLVNTSLRIYLPFNETFFTCLCIHIKESRVSSFLLNLPSACTVHEVRRALKAGWSWDWYPMHIFGI